MTQVRGWNPTGEQTEGGARRPSWSGAAGLRAERGRRGKRLKTLAFIGALFLYGLLQVRLSTEVAERSSRITGLKTQLKKVEVDLAVAQSRLSTRRIYGALMGPAEEGGFGPGGEHRSLTLAVAPQPQHNDLTRQMAEELSAGLQMLLPQALAQEVRAAGTGRESRP